MATDLPEKPLSREEAYLADIAGQEVVLPEKPESRKEQYLAYIAENGGGGGGGTNNFNQLTNRPKYNGTTMTGNTNIPEVKEYSNFTGTDGTSAGAAGLVPAPATTDAGKFLKADGTWDTAGGGSVTPVQTTGTSTTDVMSQNATTTMVYPDITNHPDTIKLGSKNVNYTEGADSVAIGGAAAGSAQYTIAIGANAVATGNAGAIGIGQAAQSTKSKAVGVGYGALAKGNDSISVGTSANTTQAEAIAIGHSSRATSTRSISVGYQAATSAFGAVALGANSSAANQGEVNIGSSDTDYGYNSSNYRLISGVYDPQTAHDAATKGYVDGKVLSNAGAPTTATEGTVGQLLEDTTNGKLYQCTAVTPGTDPDPDTYTWTEVGAGGGGTGAVVELTTADYDYTLGATTGVALWRLEAGLYHTANDVQAFAGSDSEFKLSLNSHLIIIDDSGNQKMIKVVGDDFSTSSAGVYKGFVQYKVAASDGSGTFVQSESVVSTASLMIVRSTAPTSSNVGFRGQLWYDSANNKLYVNINRPTDYAGNWKEITLA